MSTGEHERRPVPGAPSEDRATARQRDKPETTGAQQLPEPQQGDELERRLVVRDGGGRADVGRDRAEANADPWWWSNAQAGIATLARSGQEFAAEDLVEQLGLAEPSSSKSMGAAFAYAHRRGVIRCTGARASRRRATRGALVRVWRGTEQAMPLPAARAHEGQV